MAMMSRVSSKGQITIPAEFRKSLNISGGSQVRFVMENGELKIKPVNDGIEALRGIIKVEGPQDFAGIREKVMEDKANERYKDY
ncbi:MAG TPA: AbrB/MazE/SpoVT family DNA-binding domain-containing protein [Syntrophomonas wolfei]|jgi:AbrB family looped-hinge helix DNA binding protein|uniref:AbrB/MazE/SpoVT family DNA-binding domain-containing protein n=2 Tax=Syntrophomonas wolfei TaxID=863 RepID=A0A354YX38_9FIRM|nr:AbrB/MazE/SpoVT family DNA-binding domain-containing protein [Syntrophomonas wolfei]